jgi:D-alanyl-D-alanine carboxypeptidase
VRKVTALVMTFLILFSGSVFAGGTVSPPAAAPPDKISAKSAALLVAENGEVLWEKDAQTPRPMASTTKLMTALLACESGRLEQKVAITDAMNHVEGTSMGLKTGDTPALRALVAGAMLASGNDAANAIALKLGGTAEHFAQLMNAKAVALGMSDTTFVTPSGLDADGHQSTALDMAKLAVAVTRNAELSRICATQSTKVSVGGRDLWLKNHNRLLRELPGCIGLKTGFTKKAGRCLVTAARREGVTLVCVTLSASSDWQDHKKLLEYGFATLQNRAGNASNYALPIVGGEQESVTLAPSQMPILPDKTDIRTSVYIRPFEYAPIEKGRIVGEICYTSGGKTVYRVPLITTQTVKGKRSEF